VGVWWKIFIATLAGRPELKHGLPLLISVEMMSMMKRKTVEYLTNLIKTEANENTQ
jgi:hypothetical protein